MGWLQKVPGIHAGFYLRVEVFAKSDEVEGVVGVKFGRYGRVNAFSGYVHGGWVLKGIDRWETPE